MGIGDTAEMKKSRKGEKRGKEKEKKGDCEIEREKRGKR